MRPKFLIGVDEAGRGPLAGPLAVGACLVPLSRARDARRLFFGAKDSKQLSPAARERWFRKMREAAAERLISYRTAFVGHALIDRRGISWALRTAIRRSLAKLIRAAGASPAECRVILDGGIAAPKAFADQETIVRGDEKELFIALASIAAKVRRDRRMVRLSRRYPGYGFEVHKGYGTALHYRRLKKLGLSPIHRRSFLRGGRKDRGPAAAEKAPQDSTK